MASGFAIVKDALAAHRPEVRAKHWRESLRQQLGPNGEELHRILFELASGKAWMATLPDGRCSEPVLPSSDVRLRAAVFLHESLYGKAVPQTEIQKAEQEAKEFESIRALNDDELEREAARIIDARKVERLTATQPQLAEFVEVKQNLPESMDVRSDELAATIWAATPSEEQDT